MALTFPSSPTNGDTSGDYTYDSAKGAWRKNAALPVSVTHSDVAPSNPRVGDQWWKSNEGTLFTYYNDGTSSQWVESTNVIANVEQNPIPAGAMMAWASNTIPANWLLCDGSAVSRSTYASLFVAIGTTYGAGDGTTTFNLPNLKGRTIVGGDSSQTEFDTLGETGGSKTHTLTTAEMPSHTHVQDAHSHSVILWSTYSGVNPPTLYSGTTTAANSGSPNATYNGATTATNQNTGGGGAHNNLQPYIVLNYIIKTSAGSTPDDSELVTRLAVVENKFNTGQNDVPAGSITQFAGPTVPTNWLLCDGSAVSRSTWPSLFSAIGTTYGSGDGTTTFNLPDIPNGTAAGVIASATPLSTQIPFSSTTLVDIAGLSVSANIRAGRQYRITMTSSQMSTASTGRMQLKFVVDGVSVDNQYFSNPGTYGEVFVAETTFTPTVDSPNATIKMQGIIDIGSGTFYFYADTVSKITFVVEDMGEAGGSSLRPKHIIKATAGVSTNDSTFVTRLSTLENQNNATPLSSNYIINGALDYWQRSTSAAQAGNSSGFPSADRMRVISAGASSPAITLARSTDVPAGLGAQYSGALSWSSSIASADIIIHHGIENGKYLFAGKTVTVSFYAKAATAIMSAFCFDQDYGATTYNLTTSWARYSYTITLPSTYASSRPGPAAQNDNTELRFIRFNNIASSSNTIYFTGIQVEEGPYATPFRRSAPSLQAEFAACQRYYVREYLYGGGAVGGGGTVPIVAKQFKVPMRATPSYSWISGGTAMDGLADVSITGTYSQPFRSESVDGMELLFTSGALGTGRGVTVRGALVQFSAEI